MLNAWKVALKLIFMWILSLKAYFSKAWAQPELTVKARWSPKPKKSSSSVVCSGGCTQITKIRHHEFVAKQVFKWGANLIRPSKILRKKNSFIKEPEFFFTFGQKCFNIFQLLKKMFRIREEFLARENQFYEACKFCSWILTIVNLSCLKTALTAWSLSFSLGIWWPRVQFWLGCKAV